MVVLVWRTMRYISLPWEGFSALVSQRPVVRTDSFLSLQEALSLRKHHRLERELTEALKGRDRGAYGQILNEQNLQA